MMQAAYGVSTVLRDGVILSSNVYLPDAGGPFPLVLVRTCYNKSNRHYEDLAAFFCAHGYAFAVNDVRGRGDSDGCWIPWESEFNDGYDVIEWAAGQPWCSGRVGTLGGSYEGWVQWATADMRPPHLAAMIASASPGDWFHDWPHRAGAFGAADYLEWLQRTSERTNQPPFQKDLDWIKNYPDLGTIDTALGRPMPEWQTCLAHPQYDAYWGRLAIRNYAQIDVPVLHITGYYDACAPGQLHHFHSMRRLSPAADRQHLLIGAWNHGQSVHSGRAVDSTLLGLGDSASLELRPVWLAWFDRWLKGLPNEVDGWQAVRYYSMGEGAWNSAAAWPPEEAVLQPAYLRSDGLLSFQPDEDGEDSLAYVYDPADPLSAFEDLHTSLVSLEWFPYRTNDLERRSDVLCFTSAPLEDTLEVAGPIELVLRFSSSAVDTDFAGILADVHPDGSAVMISQGIGRAGCRNSVEKIEPLVPGEVVMMRIPLSDAAHAFRPGHRLRLLVTSSLYPWFHPNPNTGELYASADDLQTAEQRVYCGGLEGSKLILPVRQSSTG
jgi:putative CocE/NonD family hydrolase